MAPIRSTKGARRLVSFGIEPVRVEDGLIELSRTQEASGRTAPKHLFKTGERVRLTEGPIVGIERIYKMADGERRVILMIEILINPTQCAWHRPVCATRAAKLALVIGCLAKNLSQSRDGVAQCVHPSNV